MKDVIMDRLKAKNWTIQKCAKEMDLSYIIHTTNPSNVLHEIHIKESSEDFHADILIENHIRLDYLCRDLTTLEELYWVLKI